MGVRAFDIKREGGLAVGFRELKINRCRQGKLV